MFAKIEKISDRLDLGLMLLSGLALVSLLLLPFLYWKLPQLIAYFAFSPLITYQALWIGTLGLLLLVALAALSFALQVMYHLRQGRIQSEQVLGSLRTQMQGVSHLGQRLGPIQFELSGIVESEQQRREQLLGQLQNSIRLMQEYHARVCEVGREFPPCAELMRSLVDVAADLDLRWKEREQSLFLQKEMRDQVAQISEDLLKIQVVVINLSLVALQEGSVETAPERLRDHVSELEELFARLGKNLDSVFESIESAEIKKMKENGQMFERFLDVGRHVGKLELQLKALGHSLQPLQQPLSAQDHLDQALSLARDEKLRNRQILLQRSLHELASEVGQNSNSNSDTGVDSEAQAVATPDLAPLASPLTPPFVEESAPRLQ